jgi:hypothetical protein
LSSIEKSNDVSRMNGSEDFFFLILWIWDIFFQLSFFFTGILFIESFRTFSWGWKILNGCNNGKDASINVIFETCVIIEFRVFMIFENYRDGSNYAEYSWMLQLSHVFIVYFYLYILDILIIFLGPCFSIIRVTYVICFSFGFFFEQTSGERISWFKWICGWSVERGSERLSYGWNLIWQGIPYGTILFLMINLCLPMNRVGHGSHMMQFWLHFFHWLYFSQWCSLSPSRVMVSIWLFSQVRHGRPCFRQWIFEFRASFRMCDLGRRLIWSQYLSCSAHILFEIVLPSNNCSMGSLL